MSRVIKATLAITLITILLQPFFVTSCGKFRLFKPESSLLLIPEQKDLGIIKPGEKTSTVIHVIYSFGKFSRPKGFFLYENPTEIELSVKSKPSWCEVELDKNKFFADIPLKAFLFGGNQTFSVNLTVKVKDDAPGYEKEKIIITAFAKENGNIPEAKADCDVLVEADFLPNVEVKMSKPFIYLKSDETCVVSINVTNKSNMDVIVSFEIGSNLSLLSIELPANDTVRIDETKGFQLLLHAKEIKKSREVTVPLKIFYSAGEKGGFIEKDVRIRLIGTKSKEIPIDPIIAILIVVLVIAIVIRVKRYGK